MMVVGYIPTNTGNGASRTVYHTVDCDRLAHISGRVKPLTLPQAEARGLRPHKLCHRIPVPNWGKPTKDGGARGIIGRLGARRASMKEMGVAIYCPTCLTWTNKCRVGTCNRVTEELM